MSQPDDLSGVQGALNRIFINSQRNEEAFQRLRTTSTRHIMDSNALRTQAPTLTSEESVVLAKHHLQEVFDHLDAHDRHRVVCSLFRGFDKISASTSHECYYTKLRIVDFDKNKSKAVYRLVSQVLDESAASVERKKAEIRQMKLEVEEDENSLVRAKCDLWKASQRLFKGVEDLPL